MNAFRTVFPPQVSPLKISHHDRLLLVGSCFTEHIGQRLSERKFNTCLNPFGIVYNPVSMVRCIERLDTDNQCFMENDLFENAGLWHSFEHHGHFSKPDCTATLNGINTALNEASIFLKNTTRLLLTLGTADVFLLKETGAIVANNHKMPAAMFGQKRLSVGEVTDALAGILHKLLSRMPELQVVLSVSPVRHLRNGLVENQRSKAVLLLACDNLSRQFPQVQYFPAYELLLDDLRDYRFYADDMIHPSDLAVDYIWEYFSAMFFAEETRKLNLDIERILAAARHRPFNPDTPQHEAFKAAQRSAIAQLKQQWPGLDFGVEEGVFGGAGIG